MQRTRRLGMTAIALTCCAAVLAVVAVVAATQEQESRVAPADLPPAALEALKRLSGGAPWTELTTEVENGVRCYEGSWQGPEGIVEAEVTEVGDVLEIGEMMPAEKAPPGVRAALLAAAGKDATIHRVEKKTVFFYEAHIQDGKTLRTVVVTPDGRLHHDADDGGDDDED